MPEQTTISPQAQILPAAGKTELSPFQEHEIQDTSDEKLRLQTIQRKLIVGAADDPLEREADAMADRVMRGTTPSFIQKKSWLQPVESEKPRIDPFGSFIQKKETQSQDTVSEPSINLIQAEKGLGSPLPATEKSFMESRFGMDFSNVSIHNGNTSVQLSKELNAQAFTTGNDIFFNEGKFQPDTRDGRSLLAHELTHVVQQGKGVSRKIQRSPWGPCPPGVPLNAQNPFIYGAAELYAIAQYKEMNTGHVVVTNKELEIGTTLTGLPAREQKIFNKIRDGFHRDKNPQKRQWIEPADKVTDAAEATGEALEKGFQFVQQLLQPDIMDLTSLEVYDVTTLKQRDKKLNKVLNITYVPRLKALTQLNWKAGKSFGPMIPYAIPILPSKDKILCFGSTDFATHPGVITYEAVKITIPKLKKPGDADKPKEPEKAKEPEKPKEPEKAKAAGSAFNFGLGISFLSSSAGAGNAGIGISIMSDGVSVGTLSAGIVYDSQGAAIGVVSGGAGSGNISAGAGVAGAGISKDNLGAAAGTAGAGESKDNTIASAGTAGTGKTEGQTEAQAGESGDATSKPLQNGKGKDSTEEAIAQASKMDEVIKKATPAQKKLLAKMIGKQNGNYQVPDSKWMEEFLESTKNITDAEVDKFADGITGNAQADLQKVKPKDQQGDGKAKGDVKANVGSQVNKTDTTDAGTTKDKTDGGGGTAAADKYKGLNDESRKKISGAPEPVSSLFKSFTEGHKDDLKLTDEIVSKFFDAVPADLTQEEADKLAEGMVSSKGKTPDEVIAELKKSVEEIRKGKKTGETKTDTSAKKDDEKKTEAEQKPDIEYGRQMAERILKKENWDKVKGFEVVRRGDKSIGESKLNDEFSATLYQRYKLTEEPDAGEYLTATIVVVKVVATSPLQVEVLSSKAVVFMKKSVLTDEGDVNFVVSKYTIPKGTRFTHGK
jgi:hypothetical protein